MIDTTASKNTVASGSFNTQQTHDIKSGLLEAAIADYEAIATTFAVNAISDDKVRRQYSKHIREISGQVRQEVINGNMTVKEGAEYCSQLRDKLFVEYRKYTSAVGVAQAEALKLKSKGFDHYLNKYAQAQFGKNFDALTTEERSGIYYTVLKKRAAPMPMSQRKSAGCKSAPESPSCSPLSLRPAKLSTPRTK